MLGKFVGLEVSGLLLGDKVGSDVVGRGVSGLRLGDLVGLAVVGLSVGDEDGACVGAADGLRDGPELELGYIEPLREGEDEVVGSIEGFVEGCSVGWGCDRIEQQIRLGLGSPKE